jgi:hypothetical protein
MESSLTVPSKLASYRFLSKVFSSAAFTLTDAKQKNP